jgi:hypothetical protein
MKDVVRTTPALNSLIASYYYQQNHAVADNPRNYSRHWRILRADTLPRLSKYIFIKIPRKRSLSPVPEYHISQGLACEYGDDQDSTYNNHKNVFDIVNIVVEESLLTNIGVAWHQRQRVKKFQTSTTSINTRFNPPTETSPITSPIAPMETSLFQSFITDSCILTVLLWPKFGMYRQSAG